MATWRWLPGAAGRGALPPGYPPEYELTLVLRDGRAVHVRPILPSDAAELASAIAHADPETLHSRFLGGRPPRTEEEIRHLVELDYVGRFALAAFDENEHGVGIARYERDGPDVAEVAVAIDPLWRQVGLATRLLELLAARAEECGIDRFKVSFFADNVDVQDLVHAARLPEARSEGDGVVDVVVSLPPTA
jgi:RimJ/RimL family protein N-acetyltransferase